MWDIYSKVGKKERLEALRYEISKDTSRRNDDITEEQLQLITTVVQGRLPNLSRYDARTWCTWYLETKGDGSDFLRFHKGMGSKGAGKTPGKSYITQGQEGRRIQRKLPRERKEGTTIETLVYRCIGARLITQQTTRARTSEVVRSLLFGSYRVRTEGHFRKRQ